ncbi:AraC family transcriptional regulator [Marinicauda salina]|uniref:AraC family transcriptional regulator n=1 Tax=Marinicauda salina TaxID=2135793 RepID=A0A2U2BTX0_9PROT|nr:AraC family transcriptional regulator [Marinicauda salina]PWE17461.1 AraC family transcriptional regulator [Marinicauda salina]
MEALDDLLGGMTLSGAVFLDAEFTAPWCIASKVAETDLEPFGARPAHLIAYHYVVEGALSIEAHGAPPATARAGDVLVAPRNDAHVLGSGPGLKPLDGDSLVEPADAEGIARIRCGGGGERCRILCGFLGAEEAGHPLLESLPVLLKLSLDAASAGAWVEGSMRYAARELASGGAGAYVSLNRLAELLFAEAVREYMRSMPDDAGGWIAGLRDPHVGRALALIHRSPDSGWTLETLAAKAGIGRSALVERFGRHVGVSPMRYLTRHRLRAAAERLRSGRTSVAEAGYAAGYASEAAFSRAFKREFGRSPGAWRAGAERR